MSSDLLTQDYNGHLQVGQFFLVWVLARVAPMSYPVVAVGMVALSALAVALFARLLVLIGGPRKGVLVPLAVYALCPIGLASTSWWAAALQAVPLQVAMILVVDAHLRHTWTGRRRWWWAAVGSLLLGLLVTEKALLLVPLTLGLTVLVLRPAGAGTPRAQHPADPTRAADPTRPVLEVARLLRRLGRREPWRQLAPQQTLWLAYAAVSLAYLGSYLLLTDSTGEGTSLSTALTGIRFAVVDTFTVGLAGGPWRVAGTQSPPLSPAPYGPVLALVLVGVLVVLAGSIWWRGAYAVRVWLVLLGYLALDVGLLAATRLGQIGAELGHDPRYVTDAVPVAALCLALVLLPGRGPAPVRTPPDVLRLPQVRGLLLVPMLLGYLSSSLLTTGAVAHQAQTYSAADYLATLRASLAENPDAALVEGPVPQSVMASLLFDDLAVSSLVVEGMGLSRSFLEPSEVPLVVDEQGRLRPIDLRDPVRSADGPSPGCGWAADGPDGTRVPLPRAAGGVLRLPYVVGSSARAVVETAGSTREVVLLAGLHDLYVPLPRGALATDVRVFGLPIGLRACLGVVSVGAPVPRP